MKILLVHPADSAEAGAWAGTRWDWIVDLGWSGRRAYALQAEQFGSRVSSIHDVLDHDDHLRGLRDLLAVGLDQMVDSESVDWWDHFSVYPYQQLEQLLLLSALAGQIPRQAEIYATRTCPALRALSLQPDGATKNREIKSFSSARAPGGHEPGFRERSRRYMQAAFALRPSQLAQVAFDKWDADYRLRRHFLRIPKSSPTSAVLLPSAYVNVSRAQVAYARMLPHRRFLLVVTRRSGRLPELPANVELRSLGSYASGRSQSTDDEYTHLLAQWHKTQTVLFQTPLLRLANQLQCFDGFASFLKRGLGVRDAWREVFLREPISAVLSADENNPFTRLPVCLARSRKVRAVSCDHGALNATTALRRPVSDAYIVKGDMARDYYVTSCGMSADTIVVGGPTEPPCPLPPMNRATRDWIVFYSEAYELSSSRTQALYADLLPELCRLAQQTNRRVIVKLHPFESLRVRKSLVRKVLSAELRGLVDLREGPITPDLFSRAWCSFTVESSMAVESTLKGVPCFLCGWFDSSWYQYGKQYAKYSAGYWLDSPQRICQVPQLLERAQITEATRRSLQSSMTPERLEDVLLGK